MLNVIIPVGKGILMGIGAASVLGSVVTFAQKRGSKSRTVDLTDYEFYSEEYYEMVDFYELPRSERTAVIDQILDGEMVLPT